MIEATRRATAIHTTGLISAENISASPDTRSPRRHATGLKQRFRSKISRLLTTTICFLAAIDAASYASAGPLDEAAEQYRPYLIEGIGQALSGAQALQGRVAAKDVQGAKEAWISARAGWERSEVFTGGFVPDLDQKIDTWPNATTGFHAIEARLFGANHTDVEADANDLVARLTHLHAEAREIRLTPQGLLNGTAQLAYEVGENKSDGGESRISGTSLDDMRNNVAGIEIAYNVVFSSQIEAIDPKLADAARSQIGQLKALLDVSSLDKVDAPKLRRATEEFVVTLQNAAPKIGLVRPTLESSP
ncbi:MAG: EfeM/EfeO family lipoprotein [Methylocella sp.]